MDMLKKEKGVGDMVLLEEISETSLYKNVLERYNADHIYTYIGPVVVSVNPYKKIDIFTPQLQQAYRGRYYYEMPPHIYALADDSYRSMLQYKVNQCIIISGESGAGKTEASKIIMQYISFVSGSGKDINRVKDQLLSSNPILEAFGNAKTLRNDNSSRFGKYMEIQFDYAGNPVGGLITVYLLEKSRVITRSEGERGFHIFYQLIAGATDQQLKELQLKKSPEAYKYLSVSKCYNVPTVNDQKDWNEVKTAMTTLGFSEAQQATIRKTIAAILHLGNVEFQADAVPKAQGIDTVHVANPDEVEAAAKLLGVNAEFLTAALLFRSVSTGVGKRLSSYGIPLDHNSAIYVRDALAKGLYERLFLWLVTHINTKIKSSLSSTEVLSIGLLDIYGFEIFQKNSFEQFCINHCNEKLQQVFIELTLKSEQEEYVREGIEWTPVKYFDNKTICELIEKKPLGIISLLDESCLIANSSDQSFLEKLDKYFAKHDHYESFLTAKDKTIKPGEFRLKHYAGDVSYDVSGFIDKNKDTLWRDVLVVMSQSTDSLMSTLFPPVDDSKKRPETAGSQFRTAMNALIDTLLKCQPHYVRCIKPNDLKKPGNMDEERTRHQIRYLGLVENVRVRRAGFANRQEYKRFLHRYKMTTPSTWPTWKGSDRSGVEEIIKHHKLPADEFRLGKTKVFIKNPRTLFMFEEKRSEVLPKIMIKLQATWRGYWQRMQYKKTRAAINIQSAWRGYKNGIIYIKNQAAFLIQLKWRSYKANKYLSSVIGSFQNVKTDPTLGKTTKWPPVTPGSARAETYLILIWRKWRVSLEAERMVKSLSEEETSIVKQKIITYDLFHGKKPWSAPRKFEADYVDVESNPNRKKFISVMQKMFLTGGDTRVLFADFVSKINSKSAAQPRALVVTDSVIYKQDPKNYKMTKGGIPLASVSGIVLTGRADGWVLVRCSAPHPDVLVDLGVFSENEKYSEFVTVIVSQCRSVFGNLVSVEMSDNWTYNNARSAKDNAGKEYQLKFAPDAAFKVPTFKKGKGTQNFVYYS